jgi:hypothetical protein
MTIRRFTHKWMPTVIGSIAGLLALAGYLFPNTAFASYRDRLVEWAVIVAAFAMILGVFNVLRVHGERIARGEEDWWYSLALVITAGLAWIPPLFYGPSHGVTRAALDYVIRPLGASLAGVLVFTLTLGAARILRYRRSPTSILFLVVVALALVGTTPLLGVEWLADIRGWLVRVPGMAGFRGLFLGVALGTVITGLRLLMGVDRPQAGN